MDNNSKARNKPRRMRLKVDDTSGYVAAPRPGQLSRALYSVPIPSVAQLPGAGKQAADGSAADGSVRKGHKMA
jgi:hypothetical protein